MRALCSGKVWTFGDGDFGKLGFGNTESLNEPKIIKKLADVNIVGVYCGYGMSVALSNTGQVYTW